MTGTVRPDRNRASSGNPASRAAHRRLSERTSQRTIIVRSGSIGTLFVPTPSFCTNHGKPPPSTGTAALKCGFSTPPIAMTATTPTREALLDAATARREAGQLPYFGALTPEETAALLAADPQARLVDVRTRAELDWVGAPQVPASQFVHVEWNRYPGGVRNPDFLAELEAAVPKNAPVLFLCRSAARSKHAAAAATQAGYALAMDVLEGFEGAKDAAGHRKTVEGWCFRGLPWQGA